MATYQFSTLSDGQTIAFNPNADVLFFDESSIPAAAVMAITEGSVLHVSTLNKDVFLSNVSAPQLTTSNITFADGSRLLFGDNTTGTTGDAAANSIVGTTGDDHLKGFGGADTMNGGAGNDLYEVSTGDVIADSSGIDTVMSDISWNLGAGFENLTLTGTANLSGQGNSLNNQMVGNAGNNYFNGRAGSDTFITGAGNDTVDMSTGGTPQMGSDIVDGGSGIDTVDYDGYARSAISVDLHLERATGGGDAGEGTAQLISIERLIGGAFNDTISGNEAANYLDGRGGNDTVDGRFGNDTLVAGAGADTLVFSVAAGAADADQVSGFTTGTDRLAVDASTHANLGAEGSFAAGDGRFWASTAGTAHDSSDRVIYNTSNGQLWYDADGNGSGAAQLMATLQGAPALAATDISVINGSGSGGGSTINGTAGNDSLVGTDGDDTINGFGGNDTIRGNSGSDSLVGGDGNDSIEGSGDISHGAGDTLIGGAGDDTLDGALGEFQFDFFTNDRLDGGLGNDEYHVDTEGDVLVDAGGVDTVVVHALPGWTLADGFENLQLFDGEGQGSMSGIGNAANNVIQAVIVKHAQLQGLGGNDLLIGDPGGGDATMLGGDGNDTISGSANSFDELDGGAGDDLIQGNGFITGGVGNDTLNGGTNGGTLTGGTGADVFVYDETSPFIINNFGITDFASGTDTIRLDAAALSALGTSGRMAAGDARFFAAPGASSGHDADDRVVYNTSTNELFYDADGSGSGSARLLFTLQSGAPLSATDIEVVNGTPPAGGGAINGTAGNDSLAGTTGNDTINGLGGNDTLNGLAGDDRLDGGDGSDSMLGGAGNDTLLGKAGIDRLSGGAGNDNFVFDTLGSPNRDIVQDFVTGVDKLQMDNSVMTQAGAEGNFAAGDARFWASTTGTAHDASDRIIYNSSTGDLYYDADGNGAGAAQGLGNITGHPALAATDIAVI